MELRKRGSLTSGWTDQMRSRDLRNYVLLVDISRLSAALLRAGRGPDNISDSHRLLAQKTFQSQPILSAPCEALL